MFVGFTLPCLVFFSQPCIICYTRNATNVIVNLTPGKYVTQATHTRQNEIRAFLNRTYNLPITSSGDRPLSSRRLVGARPLNKFHVTNICRVATPQTFGWMSGWVGVLETFTLLQTRTLHRYPILDQKLESIPCFRPEPCINSLFQTRVLF